MHELLRKMGYETADRSCYALIDTWNDWYQGQVKSFHRYSQFNGKRKISRRRYSLSMAKKVCEDWANLIMNEKVRITLPNKPLTDRVNQILENNNFRVRANRLIELAFALGTAAFTVYRQGKEIKIDYVRADMIYPISWENGIVRECAFGGEKTVNGKSCIYIQVHTLEDGKYVIKNRLFDKVTKSQIALPEDLKPEFYTGSDIPLFQIITPNIINSADYNSPMGISIFANAIDVLKGCDLVYDSYCNEYRLGKKRIVVPAGMAQLQCGNESGMVPLFDDNDTEFYAFPDRSLTELKEINMEIRSSAHSEGLQQQLNLLSDKCGLGTDHYVYTTHLKTATEVISENSDLFRNLKKHEILIKKAICDLVNAVLFLDGYTGEAEVLVDFDDGIIEDKKAEFERYMKMIAAGIVTVEEFRAHFAMEEA